jgi:hypothetical protein
MTFGRFSNACRETPASSPGTTGLAALQKHYRGIRLTRKLRRIPLTDDGVGMAGRIGLDYGGDKA